MPKSLKDIMPILAKPVADRSEDEKSAIEEYLSQLASSGEQDENAGAKDTEINWKLVFEHPRFKELNRRAADAETQLASLQNAAKEAERKALEAQNNYKTLYENALTELNQVKAKAEGVDSLEKTLSSVLAVEIQSLPEQYRDIVPSSLPVQAQLEWLSKNKAKFAKLPTVDIGAGASGAKPPKKAEQELSDEVVQLAKDFGMTPEEYIKYTDKEKN